MRIALAVVTAAALSGCAAQMASQDDATCQGYGAAPASPEYVDCRVRLTEMHNQQARQFGAALSRGIAANSNCNSPSKIDAFTCGFAAGAAGAQQAGGNQ